MRRFLPLILILVLAAFLRLWNISNYPSGFTPDEASFGYDAYSILKTEKDQWGQIFPLSFRSFGDFKAPLYTYLAVPSVAIFGLNEFSVRLPNALVGTMAVLIIYFLVLELFRGKQYTIRYMPLAAALLLAISPWHISLSRGAFEANLTIFMMPLGVYAFLRGLGNRRWMIISVLAFGLNLFSYHSAKVITPLILLTLLLFYRKQLTTALHSVVVKASVLILLLFFGLSVFSFFSGSGLRAGDIAIFNPTGGWGALYDQRLEAIGSGLPEILSKVIFNKLTYVLGEFTKSYLSYLSPTFLFIQGAGEATYGMIPGHGVLYLFELPFVLVALFMAARRPSTPILLIIAWILLSPIPTALTKGPGFAANRAAVMMPAIQILSAYGAVLLWEKFKKRRLWLGLYGSLGVLEVLFFLEAYSFHGPRVNAPSMSYGWGEAVREIREVRDNYHEIVVSRALSEPHIFVAFYNAWDPADYQKESADWRRYEKQHLPFVDQLGEWHLDKYTFRDIKYDDDSSLENVLLVGRPKDFPENVSAVQKIMYPDGKPAIFIVDPAKQKYAKVN